MKRALKIDDSLDVFPVHGVGGMLGTLLTAVFAAESLGGLGLETSISAQLATQFTGVIATVVWCGAITLLILFLIDKVLGIRVTPDQETEGLDVTQHNERGYIL